MERLTERINGKLKLKKQFPTVEDTIDILASKLELFEDAEQSAQWVRLPCNFDNLVYHICQCKDIPPRLDGTMYGMNGGPGTATGYYCPYEDNCPHDTDDCDLCRDIPAVFEDSVTGFHIGDDGNYAYLENTPNVDFSGFGKTVFLSEDEAQECLKNQKEASYNE